MNNSTLKYFIFNFILVIAVYILATNYYFQLWSSILFTVIVVFGYIGLLFIFKNYKNSNYISALIIFVLIFITIPLTTTEPVGFTDCAYEPIEVDYNQDMDFRSFFEPTYYETDDFIGITSYTNSSISLYDIANNQVNSLILYVNQLTEISSITYLNGYLYVAGEYIYNDFEDDDRYTLLRIPVNQMFSSFYLEDIEYEILLESSSYITVYLLHDELLISYNNGIDGRYYYSYDEDFDLIDSYYDFGYISNVFNYQDYFIINKDNHYYLYYNKELIKELAEYNSKKQVTFYDNQIYITNDQSVAGQYKTDVFDLNGNLVYEYDDILVGDADNYLIFLDNYIVENYVFNYDELVVNQSKFYDYNYNEVCFGNISNDLKIIPISSYLYASGSYNSNIYDFTELTYSVPIKYNNPAHNIYYILSIITLLIIVIKTKKYY